MRYKIFYYRAEYGTIFWTGEKRICTSVHENDGGWNDYLQPLFTLFDVQVEQVKDKPEWLTNEILQEHGIGGYDDEFEENY